MGYKWEKYYPWLGSVICSFVVFIIEQFRYFGPDSILKDVLSATVNMSAISVGFLATALTILYALSERQIINNLKAIPRGNTNAYNTILGYMVSAVKCSLILCVFCLISIPFSTEESNIASHNWISIILAFLLTFTSLSLFRVVHILAEMLKD